LDYPTIRLEIDRVKAGQLGITSDQIAKSTVEATSSSRFTTPSYWLDKTTGTAYQVQVQYPEYRMNSTEQLEMIPIVSGNNTHYLNEVATWRRVNSPGEYDRLNQQRYITITANIYKEDAGSAFKKVKQVIASMNPLPTGSKILLRGQSVLFDETVKSLQFGILIAIIVVFLLLSIYFQSFRVAIISLSVVPAVIAGSLFLLLITGQTLNIQSYIGVIMAIGVSISNAILLITNAEYHRRLADSTAPNLTAAFNRLRPILMTSMAMIAGMIPMAVGIGNESGQTAPLGIAVIGGLLFSSVAILFFLPHVYQWSIGKKPYIFVSLDPDDVNSKNYIR
jgi:multidrug efflux pump subunit AcrB